MSKRHRNKIRETSAPLFYREMQFRAEDVADDGTIRVIASTDATVDFGGYREVLKHDAGSVDFASCRSALLNHDKNQIIGGVRNITIKDGQCLAQMTISPDARTQTGVKVIDLVRSGALSGVSIGYTYSDKNAQFNEDTRTVTASKWMLREISLTPTQADTNAHTQRSLPETFKSTAKNAENIKEKQSMNLDQFIALYGEKHRALLVKMTGEKKTDAEVSIAIIAAERALAVADAKANDEEAGDEKSRAAEFAKLRLQAQIVPVAESHGLKGSDYFDAKDFPEALKRMVKDKADADKSRTGLHYGGGSSVNVDQADKARDAFVGALSFGAGFKDGALGELQKNNPLVGRGMLFAIKRYARLMGLDTQDWTNKDTAFFAMGKPEMMDQRFQRDANVTSSTFPNFVFLNALTKTVARGYELGSSGARYKEIIGPINRVPDFKPFYVGALAGANLVQTAENTPFPELTKAEGVYNSTAKMWGGTISLTVQALANDDTSAFDRLMRQAGVIADKTVDKRVFQKLLMGTSAVEATSTWTSNTTSGGSLVYTTQDLMAASRAKLGLVRAAMINKVGLDNNPMGNIPRILAVPVTREVEAQAIIGASGPGLAAGTAQAATQSMRVVASPWLEYSGLTGYSVTSYYVLADPNEVTGLILTNVIGYESVQVQPYDAGAVAAMNFKLWLPFEADLHYVTVGSTKTIAGAQQGTT